jgi:hypothetical protein
LDNIFGQLGCCCSYLHTVLGFGSILVIVFKVAIDYRFLRRFDCLEAFELVILQAKNAFSNKVLKVFILRVFFKKKKIFGVFFF